MVRAFHDVIISHDEKFVISLADDDAGTGGLSLSGEGLSVEGLHFLCEIVVYRDDRRHHLVYHFGEFCVRSFRLSDDQAGVICRAFINGSFRGLLCSTVILCCGCGVSRNRILLAACCRVTLLVCGFCFLGVGSCFLVLFVFLARQSGILVLRGL